MSFAIKWYDVNFQLTYLGGFEEIYAKQVILLKTGLYKITFDKFHSWFTEKQLRYRVFVLENIQGNKKHTFPFHEITRNDEKIKGKKKFDEKCNISKYYISKYKAVMY